MNPALEGQVSDVRHEIIEPLCVSIAKHIVSPSQLFGEWHQTAPPAASLQTIGVLASDGEHGVGHGHVQGGLATCSSRRAT
jgi:hypothetical protein